MEWHDGLNFTDEVEHDGTLHLVTLNSEGENNFLIDAVLSYPLLDGNVWLGFTDEYEEGVWQWVTGESVNYTNWLDGEQITREELNIMARCGWMVYGMMQITMFLIMY